MNPDDRLNLQKMIKANNVSDCTSEIRDKRHSDLIRKDVRRMIQLGVKHSALRSNNPDEFDKLLINECNFLFTKYTDIFNKVKKNEIDFNILNNLLDVLKKIELGELDQHSGSFEVGKLLKALYVDSAIKKGNNLDNEHVNDIDISRPPAKKITWKQYKLMQQ